MPTDIIKNKALDNSMVLWETLGMGLYIMEVFSAQARLSLLITSFLAILSIFYVGNAFS